jgi:hypothetical protein
MSVSVCVFLNPARMVTPQAWAEAIKSNGFDMSLQTDFDSRGSPGFVPCTYRGKGAGFEYGYEVFEGADLRTYGMSLKARRTTTWQNFPTGFRCTRFEASSEMDLTSFRARFGKCLTPT